MIMIEFVLHFVKCDLVTVSQNQIIFIYSSSNLVQPPSKTKFGSLAFHTAAPLIWNGLPADVRSSSPSFQAFKKMLKTYYFRSHPT